MGFSRVKAKSFKPVAIHCCQFPLLLEKGSPAGRYAMSSAVKKCSVQLLLRRLCELHAMLCQTLWAIKGPMPAVDNITFEMFK